jgi:Trk/Ktr/HKT type cation transporter
MVAADQFYHCPLHLLHCNMPNICSHILGLFNSASEGHVYGFDIPHHQCHDGGVCIGYSLCTISPCLTQCSGLNTINLSTLNTFQQIIIFILMLLGSSIFVSAFVVTIRSRAFELRFKEVLEEEKLKRERKRSNSPSLLRLPFSRRSSAIQPTENPPETEPTPPLPPTETSLNLPSASIGQETQGEDDLNDNRVAEASHEGSSVRPSDVQVTWAAAVQAEPPPKIEAASPAIGNTNVENDFPNVAKTTSVALPLGGTILEPQHKHLPSRLFYPHGVGARFSHIALPQTQKSEEEIVEISKVYVRNSETTHLTHMERLRLGGVEYRATRLLVWIVPAYFILWQLFGCIGLGAWITINTPTIARSNGLNPFWAGAFNGVSAFNNNGYSLIDANMTVFQTSNYILITMALMILAGNTCYPIFLRLIVWVLLKMTPEGWTEEKESLLFLLNHPRRCYTNLFPSNDTWWLLLAVIGLNGIDWAGFLILNVSSLYYTPLESSETAVISALTLANSLPKT